MGGILWRETSLKYAYQRRYQLQTAEHRLEIPDGIDCYTDYVETPNGHVIHTKCLIPRKEYIDTPTKRIKGMICYCVGYTSHVDWCMTMIGMEWCRKGYIFFMNDHYGHGSSDGLFCYIPDFNVIVEDAFYVFEFGKKIYTPSIIKDKNERFNYFMMGQSMGGNIALQICLKYQDKIKRYRSSHWRRNSLTHNNINDPFEYDENDYIQYIPPIIRYPYNGMLFISPMIKISGDTKPGPLVTFLLKKVVLPWIPSAPIVPSSTSEMSRYSTRDMHKLAFMNKDPLSWNLGARLLHGTDDKITDHCSSDMLYQQTGTLQQNKCIKKYKDAYHHLLMEFCSDEVYNDLDEWMQERSNKITLDHGRDEEEEQKVN
eukprot:971494_1